MNTPKDDSGMDAGAIALKLGIEAIKRTAPAGIAWVSTYVRGATILVVGPSGSGKTSFVDYMTYGLLLPSSRHITTVEEQASPTFSISVGSNATLKLRVRKTLDQPGQIGPMAHANLVKKDRPHGIIVVLDANRKASENNAWISEFGDNLDRVFRESQSTQKKVKSIIICLNKRDLVKNASHFQSRSDGILSTFADAIEGVVGNQVARHIPVLPCVSVLTDAYGSTLADAVIAKLAKDIGRA